MKIIVENEQKFQSILTDDEKLEMNDTIIATDHLVICDFELR